MINPDHGNEALWVSRADMARLLGRSERRVDQLRSECNGRYDRGEGAELRIYIPGIIAHWHGTKPAADDNQRLRRIQADMAEEKLRQIRDSVVGVDQVQADCKLVGDVLRENAKCLCRHCRDLFSDGLASIQELN